MSLLGLADTAFDFRGRAARRRGPPILKLKPWRTTMEVILLEQRRQSSARWAKWCASRMLCAELPAAKGKALRATESNKSKFEA